MRRVDHALAVVLIVCWLTFFGFITWLEWVRPRTPDPAHGFTHHLKGLQTIVYVTQSDIAWRDGLNWAAMLGTVAVMALAAWARR